MKQRARHRSSLTVVLVGAFLVLLATAGLGLWAPLAAPAPTPTPSPAPAPAPASHPAVAPPLKAIWGPFTMPDGSSAFPVYHRLGVQVLEFQLRWSSIAPTRPSVPEDSQDPAYHWPASLDSAVAQAAHYGIKIALRIAGFPAWSNGGHGSSTAPTDPMDYARFMQAASRRYPSVHYWMILSEVNYPGNFVPLQAGSPAGPERYAVLLDDAYGALKAVSPYNLVIGGMTYSGGVISAPTFNRWMRLPNGARPRMDYYGYDPYSVRFPRLAPKPYSPTLYEINNINTLEQQLEGLYHRHAPKLWLAEFGISTSANGYFDYYVSKPVQARWVTAAFKLVGSVPYVAALGWYKLLDDADPVDEPLTEGLMTARGQPKPSFEAYARVP
jgi:hypothetical protein